MKTINGWTKQGVIDHITANYKGRSTNSSGTCRYRGDHERRCVVGVFIPDNLYRPEMEGKPADVLWNIFSPLRSVLPFEFDNLMDLQEYHDRSLCELVNLIKFLQKNIE